MELPPWLRALESRDFRIFWTGQLVSLVGTWMQTVGQAWLVLSLTNSAFRLGLISSLQFLPLLCLSFLGGVIADRLPKRRLIMATQTALMLQAFTLAVLVWTGHVQYWHVAVLALLLGVANALDMPARQAFVAELVPRPMLMNAIALNSASFNAARVVGPAVAGLLVARYGVGTAFFLNGLSFIAVLGALLAVQAEGQPRPHGGATVVEQILEGVRYALRTPQVALILGLVLVVSVFLFNFNVLVPLLARQVLGVGAHGFGLLMATFGAGALAGALLLAVSTRSRPAMTFIVGSAVVLASATALMGTVRHLGAAAALLFVIGLSGIAFMASCNTTLQITAPDELRGRTMSLYTLAFAGTTPFGALLVGTIAERWGVPVAFLVGGSFGLAGVGAFAAWWQLARRHLVTSGRSLAFRQP
jgi:MFS family permease